MEREWETIFLYELIFMVTFDLYQGFGLDLQTTEIFLLNDLGSELCIEKKGGGGRERDTPHREGGRRLDGAVLA